MQNPISSQKITKMVIKPLCCAVASSLAVMGYSASVQAQSSSSPTDSATTVELPSIRLVVPSENGFRVAPMTPEAFERSYKATRGGANVVKPRGTGSQANLNDAIGTQPGVTLLGFFGGNDHPIISIRGSGIQSQPVTRGLNFLVDGMPINDADGTFHAGMVEPHNVSMIGIRRGANALHPSSQTLGGEINFLSHTGATETGSFSFQYGSDATLASRFAIGRAFDNWDFHIALSDQRTDSFREHGKQRRQAFRANLGVRGSQWQNRTWLSYTNQHFEVPGPLTEAEALSDDHYEGTTDRLPLKPLLTDPKRHTRVWRIANMTTFYHGPWTHSVGAFIQHSDDDFQMPPQVWEMDLDTYGLQYLADATFGRFSVGAGLSYTLSDGDYNVRHNPLQPLPPLRLMHHQDYKVEAQNLAAQLRAGWQFLPEWNLSGELRYVHTSREIKGQRPGLSGRQSFDDDWNWLSPKIALSWEPNSDTLFFANFSTSREAPTFRDLVQFAGPRGDRIPGTPFKRGIQHVRALEPQKNKSFELGGRGTFNQRYGWDITLYHADIEGELIGYSPDGSNRYVYNYEDDTKHQGVELGLTGQWDLGSAGQLAARLSYTYNRFKFDGGPYDGNYIAGLPRQFYGLNLDYRYGDLLLGLNLKGALGSSYGDHANTQKMSGYNLLGANLSYFFHKESNVYLQVDNITDKRFLSWTMSPERGSPNTLMYIPGQGRHVTAGINFKF